MPANRQVSAENRDLLLRKGNRGSFWAILGNMIQLDLKKLGIIGNRAFESEGSRALPLLPSAEVNSYILV